MNPVTPTPGLPDGCPETAYWYEVPGWFFNREENSPGDVTLVEIHPAGTRRLTQESAATEQGEASQRSLTCSACGGIRLGVKGSGIHRVCVDSKCIAYHQIPPHAPTKTDTLYQELLYAVARKFPGETRHQTALRYIRYCEEPKSTASVAPPESAEKRGDA